MIKKSTCEASHSHSPIPTHSHSHLIPDPESAYYDDAGGGFATSSVTGVCRSRIQDQVAVAVAVSGAVAVAVAGLTKRFFNHIQKNFSINVWGYSKAEDELQRFCEGLLQTFLIDSILHESN